MRTLNTDQRVSRAVAFVAVAMVGSTNGGFAQELKATATKFAAPLQIQQVVSCNPAERSLETIQRAAALDDAVADHHRRVPIMAVEREGPLEDSPPPQRPAATEVATPAAANLTLVSSVAIASAQGLTSVVGEPSVAARGQEVLYTGNWYAAFSTDGGITFNCVDPARTFPLSARQQEFCCDQVVAYSPEHDVMIWLLQYSRWSGQRPNQVSVENIHRLAVASGADIRAQRWRYYDINPSALGASADEWFDYPDLAVSGQFLYLTSNAFETTGNIRFTRSVAARFPLRQLRNYEALDAEFIVPPSAGTLKLTRGATTTMHFGTHVRAGSAQFVRVYSWPDNTAAIRENDVLVQRWAAGSSAAVAPGPDGNDWLARRDGRITAAWLAGNRIGFAWTAAHATPFRYPHVRVVLVNPATMVAAAQPHIWNDSYAYAYPAAAPNRNGGVGIVVAYGGNTLHPSLGVGFLDNSGGSTRWRLARAATGTNGPGGEKDEGKWGDYLALQGHPTDAAVWVAAGFTLQGGSTGDDIEPRYVAFRSGAGLELTEDNATERLVRESLRLEAIWQQQPTNAAALQRAVQRLENAVEAANAATAQPVDRPSPPPPPDKQSVIDDTHRPTPADSPAPVSLTDAQIKQITAAAAATVKQFETSMSAGRKDLAVEKKAIAALTEALKPVK